MQHWNFSKDREQSKSEYIRGLLNLTLLQNSKYEISLILKMRAMQTDLNNDYHVIVWLCMVETNLSRLQCVVIINGVTTIKIKNMFDTNQSMKWTVIIPCRIQEKKDNVGNILGQYREFRYIKIVSSCSEMAMTLSLLQIVKLFFNPLVWEIVAADLEIDVHSWLKELHKKHIMIKSNTCEEIPIVLWYLQRKKSY